MLAHNLKNIKIAVIGLGYVGLPLAVEFGKKYKTIGFDINQSRIEELKKGHDYTRETSKEELKSSLYLQYESNSQGLTANVYIITVPTLIDAYKKPDLTPLIKASETVGKVLKQGDIVIYESTVYPGCTEEDCVPVLEKYSGLKFNKGFYCGYSPERINLGDKERTLTKILKITSGSIPKVADFVDDLYNSILEAGTYKATSMKVAEAAKLIENCQRDVNISFVNELALIFDRMGIDTTEVLEAAGSKWNFLKFKPGLVGGRCISVASYYMIHKAGDLGCFPTLIGAGRKINDNMGLFVANKVIKLMIQKGIRIEGAKALILGITFKENCTDIRNSKVVDIYNELQQFRLEVDVYDSWADSVEVEKEYNFKLLKNIKQQYDTIIVAVSHQHFLTINLNEIKKPLSVIFDVKTFLPKVDIDGRL